MNNNKIYNFQIHIPDLGDLHLECDSHTQQITMGTSTLSREDQALIYTNLQSLNQYLAANHISYHVNI